MTYTLYGGPVSLYTGKVRSYLRKQNIDFVEVSPGSDRYLNDIVPKVGRWIIPCMETPDGTILQDGADIIDHFDSGQGQGVTPRYPVYPESPVLLAITHLFEIFGGEGLLRPAMHYRWNFDDQNLEFIISEFRLVMPVALSADEAREGFLHSSGRMRKAAVGFGVTPETIPTIETAFEEWLGLFEAHLVDHPYLLGRRPTIGDFGLMAAMWAHLFRDPAPASLIKRIAPRVGRWVERMSTREPYEQEYGLADNEPGALFADDELPETLLAMMAFVAEEYQPEMAAHVEFANQWLTNHETLETGTNGSKNPGDRGIGMCPFEWRGLEITTGVMPYRFWLLQRLHDDVASAAEADQARVRETFAAAGLEGMLDLRTIRRVERTDHLEVWGPLV